MNAKYCTVCGEEVLPTQIAIDYIGDEGECVAKVHSWCTPDWKKVLSPNFFDRIKQFNDFYKIESNEVPEQLSMERLLRFKDILSEELDEAGTGMAEEGEDFYFYEPSTTNVDLVKLADWLGDIIVYCASEARRWGIPIEEVLQIIMDSNMSKAQPCGKCAACQSYLRAYPEGMSDTINLKELGELCTNPQPLYDDRGKVLKGSNYWKPEPKIRELLQQRMRNEEAR